MILHCLYLFSLQITWLSSLWIISRQFEKRNPVEAKQSTADIITDWKLAGLRLLIKQLLSPLTAACSVMIVNALGGGWIQLRSDGWWFLLSSLVFILTIDFYGYVLHYAFHKIPVLWAMHSLHHSAEALTLITGARHFWLEDPLFGAIFPIMGVIFKVPLEITVPVAFIYLTIGDALVHLNFRVSFGRFVLVLNNPQLHRIHHSLEPQHWNKNFCKMLPLFDVIFGTAYKPGKDEFPATGLAGEKATGFIDGIIWPIRHRLVSVRSTQVTVG